MDSALIARVASDALQLTLWLSAPALLASLIAGLGSGLFQAATQVQDPALSFVPRLLAVGAALLVSAAWMAERMLAFTSALWRELPRLLS
jgi:flagellar biosynthetic protein FliQ